MEYLAHSASFHSLVKNAPSKPGIKHLDSDVLFIVSALIRKVVGDVRAGKGSVWQVFVLTHNIYFHKEVSYDRKRPGNERLPFG